MFSFVVNSRGLEPTSWDDSDVGGEGVVVFFWIGFSISSSSDVVVAADDDDVCGGGCGSFTNGSFTNDDLRLRIL